MVTNSDPRSHARFFDIPLHPAMENAPKGVPIASSSFDDLNAKIQAAALKATRNGAVLPGDIGFHKSMEPDLAKEVDHLAGRVMKLQNRLLSLVVTLGTEAEGKWKGKGKASVKLLSDEDDIVDGFQSFFVDCVDQLLERTVSSYCHYGSEIIILYAL